jgi:hypothetical protein
VKGLQNDDGLAGMRRNDTRGDIQSQWSFWLSLRHATP